MLNTELKEILLASALCKYLEPSELDMLLRYSTVVSFDKDQRILKQGDRNENLFIILQGTVRVSAKILGEGFANIAVLSPGNMLGEISLFEKGPAATSAIAIEPVECLQVNYLYFDMLTQVFPKTKYNIERGMIEQIYIRLKTLHTKITKYMFDSHMIAKSLFSNVIRTLTSPSQISLEKANISLKHLKNALFFKNLNDDEFACVIKHSIILNAPKKCILIHEGEKKQSFHIILRGAVQSSIIENNIIAKLSVLGPLEFFCSTSLIDYESKSLFNYTACERAIVLTIPEKNLVMIQNECIAAWYKLYSYIYQSFVALERAADALDVRLNSELYNR
ncbi:MAG: cyclic nucleotide-binding domain-containing protein [Gammaproteobacteria bacterium]